MAKDGHSWDAENLPELHKYTTGGDASLAAEAGACLNRHNAGRNRATGFLTKSSCNYRWQAFRRALDVDHAKYNWPAYEAIHELVQQTKRGRARTTIDLLSRTRRRGKRHPVPTEKNPAWDITAGGENFQTRCTRPYWHESHHIIPDGEFQASIALTGEDEPLEEVYVKLIRGGLLEEKYNLNHLRNMIILPMASEVAYALGLPRHRVSADTRSHDAYSQKVWLGLNGIFKPLQDEVKAHAERPKYAECKEALESLSDSYRRSIEAAGKAMRAAKELEKNSLEDMFGEQSGAGTL